MKYADLNSSLEISIFQYGAAPQVSALPESLIHIWQADLQQQDETAFLDSLSEDEITRASRFHFARDRRRYVVARGILRQLLSGYLNLPARQIQFSYAPQGKPLLLDPEQNRVLRFNLAHSFERALFAFAYYEIGVDIETMRDDIEIELIAPSIFSPVEMAQWQALPGANKRSAFFSLWARKEAFVKATGLGIGYPLQKVTVGFSVEASSQVTFVSEIGVDEQRFLLWDIPAVPNTRAALVLTFSSFI